MKRIFDVSVSAFVILVALPLWMVTAVLIKLDSRGPILHRGVRIGRDARPFGIYKFRTMVVGAAQIGHRVTGEYDDRITRVGRGLRKLKIDEMPQLINVIRGEMSIVGPRPEDPHYVAHYTPEQRAVLSVRPGMASPAFLKYRHEETILSEAGQDLDRVYVEQILPDKLRLDLDYIAEQTFLYDTSILLRAAWSLFRRSPKQDERGQSARS